MKSSIAAGLAALSFAVASPAMADLVGATYDFSGSATGATDIAATSGTHTDPANPGFCVGPPLECGSGSGMSGSFTFADVNPTLSTITFTFFGSTDDVTGGFSIDLGNFVTTDGDRITDVTYASGTLEGGDFTHVTWNGADAVFTGATAGGFDALDGRNITFDVTMAAVPEPATWAMMLLGFAGLGLAGYRSRRRAISIV